MKRAIKPATRTEQAYQDAARALGCVVCRYRIARGLQGAVQCGPTQIHHLNLGDLHGQKQLGQDRVVALGAWHHDGDQLPRHSRARMHERFGPSFKHHAREFRAWTSEVLGDSERGTAAWQLYQDRILERLKGFAR